MDRGVAEESEGAKCVFVEVSELPSKTLARGMGWVFRVVCLCACALLVARAAYLRACMPTAHMCVGVGGPPS